MLGLGLITELGNDIEILLNSLTFCYKEMYLFFHLCRMYVNVLYLMHLTAAFLTRLC